MFLQHTASMEQVLGGVCIYIILFKWHSFSVWSLFFLPKVKYLGTVKLKLESNPKSQFMSIILLTLFSARFHCTEPKMHCIFMHHDYYVTSEDRLITLSLLFSFLNSYIEPQPHSNMDQLKTESIWFCWKQQAHHFPQIHILWTHG